MAEPFQTVLAGRRRPLVLNPFPPGIAFLLGLALAASFWLGGMVSRLDILLALLAGLVVALLTWVMGMRMAPRVPVVILSVLAGLGAANAPWVTAWMVAAGVAGLAGALLTRRVVQEEWMMLGPVLASAGMFAVLVALFNLTRLDQVVGQIDVFFDQLRQFAEQEIATRREAGQAAAWMNEDAWAQIVPVFGPAMTAISAGLWALGLWLVGRLARTLTGSLVRPLASILMFRMHGCMYEFSQGA